MKRILITGANSYIGTSLVAWLEQWPEEYRVETVGTKANEWKQMVFAGFDAVFHVAGIAHQNASKDMESLYYKINRDLAIEVAQKAKREGVGQFVFMSSISVYGNSSELGKDKSITADTQPKPDNFYGNSKLQAEQGLLPLQSPAFAIAIIRPPMIYGKDSKGNYPLLSRFAKKTPIFPNIRNKRSMIHIDNLCEFVRLLIEHRDAGIFYPQNKEYTVTSDMVYTIAKVSGKKLRLTKVFNPLLFLVGSRHPVFQKVFGNLYYDASMSQYKEDYWVNNLEQSIVKSETANGSMGKGNL